MRTFPFHFVTSQLVWIRDDVYHIKRLMRLIHKENFSNLLAGKFHLEISWKKVHVGVRGHPVRLVSTVENILGTHTCNYWDVVLKCFQFYGLFTEFVKFVQICFVFSGNITIVGPNFKRNEIHFKLFDVSNEVCIFVKL